MKSASILALAAGAAATGFKGVNPFTCPGNTDNKCSDTQKSGYDFGDLNVGSFSSYKDFNFFGGWSCGANSGKRFAPRTNQNYIGASCSSDKSKSPSFGCGANVDKFSLGGLYITPEFDCDLEFHYDMPDGSTCKHRNACSKSGTNIVNTQCGGAKNVTIVYPSQPSKPKSTCSVNVHTMSFDCNSASSTTVVKTTSAVKTTSTTPAVKTTSTTEAVKTTSTSEAVKTTTKEKTTSTSTTTEAKETTSSSTKETTTKEKTTTSASFANTTSVQPIGSVSSTSTEEKTTTSAPLLTTSTIFTTSTQTITSCAAEITNCPAESQSVVTTVVTVAVSTTICPVTETETATSTKAPATTTTPSTPVETLPCPDVVPKCLSTFLFTVGCADNTDSNCYCPNEIFIKSVFDCVFAHGETDEIISESVIFIQGLCAPQVPQNPAIATGATITSYVTPTVTVTQPAVYTTVTVDATTVVPCTNSAGEIIPSSSSTAVIQTTLTVPQIGFTSTGDSVGVVPVTSYTTATTAAAKATTSASKVVSSGVASSTGKVSPTSSGVVVVSGSGRVSAGFGFALAVMGLVAAL